MPSRPQFPASFRITHYFDGLKDRRVHLSFTTLCFNLLYQVITLQELYFAIVASITQENDHNTKTHFIARSMECSAKEVFLVWDFVVFTSSSLSFLEHTFYRPGVCFWIITVLDELFQAAQEHMGSYDHIQQCIGRLSDPFYAISNALVHDFCTLQSRFQLFLYTLATLLAIGICTVYVALARHYVKHRMITVQPSQSDAMPLDIRRTEPYPVPHPSQGPTV